MEDNTPYIIKCIKKTLMVILLMFSIAVGLSFFIRWANENSNTPVNHTNVTKEETDDDTCMIYVGYYYIFVPC